MTNTSFELRFGSPLCFVDVHLFSVPFHSHQWPYYDSWLVETWISQIQTHQFYWSCISLLYPFTHLFASLQAPFDMQCSIFFPLKVFLTIGYLVAIQSWICPDYKRLVFENESIPILWLWIHQSLSFFTLEVIIVTIYWVMLLAHIWFPCSLDLRFPSISYWFESCAHICTLIWALLHSHFSLFPIILFVISILFLSPSFHPQHFHQVGFVIHISSDLDFNWVSLAVFRFDLFSPSALLNLSLDSSRWVILTSTLSYIYCAVDSSGFS